MASSKHKIQPNMPFKVMMLGDEGVGKTAMVTKFKADQPARVNDNHIVSDEDVHNIEHFLDGEPCQLEILDIGASDQNKGRRAQWVKTSDAFILVYSTASRRSFQSIPDLYNEIKHRRQSAYPTKPVPILLVANRIDTKEPEVSTAEGLQMAQQLRCDFFDASAYDSRDVRGVFNYLAVQLTISRRELAALSFIRNSFPQWNQLLEKLDAASASWPGAPPGSNLFELPEFTTKSKRQSSIKVRLSFRFESPFRRRDSLQNPPPATYYNSEIQSVLVEIHKYLHTSQWQFSQADRRVKLAKRETQFSMEGKVFFFDRDVMEKHVSLALETNETLDKCSKLCQDGAFELLRGKWQVIEDMTNKFAIMALSLAECE